MIRFQPTHVSANVMRAYGIDHPIGDPFSGAAYGDKHKGGNALGGLGGIGSIIGGIAVIASGGTLAPLMGGLMIAGGAMSTIGAISGNNTLTKIGGITSAVGGVGAMGASIYDNWGTISESVGGWLSSGTETTSTAVDATNVANASNAATAGTDMSQWANDPNYLEALNGSNSVADSIVNTQTGASFQGGGFNSDQFANAMADQINQTAPMVSDSIAANVNPNNMFASTQGVTDAGGVGSAAKLGGGFGSAEPFSGTPAALPGSSSGFGTAGSATVGDAGGFVSGITGGNADKGLLASVGGFIKDNPLASMMGMQALSGLAQGASPKSQAEGEYLDAMASLKNAESQYLQAQQDYLDGAKTAETQANTEYLQAKAAEFDKTKQYAEEKRKAYNDSIKNMQLPGSYVDFNNSLFTPNATQQAGLINTARA